jgi:hypothetical protein
MFIRFPPRLIAVSALSLFFLLAPGKNFRFLSCLFAESMELLHFFPDNRRCDRLDRCHRNVNIGSLPDYADATRS